MMEPATWILLLAAFLVLLLVLRRVLSDGEKKGVDVDPLYIQALEALADGARNRAIQLLKASIESKPSSFSPYLLLGDLLRKKGDVERAHKIHWELSMRPNLDDDRRIMVIKSLVRDRLELKRFKEAVDGCEKILEIDKRNREAIEMLLASYEGMRMWNEAIDTAKRYARLFLDDGKTYLAYYLSFAAREELKEDTESAKKKLKRALSLDPACKPAQIYLGDIYFLENDYDKAIEVWTGFLKNNPESIRDLTSRLEKAYFEEGQFGRMVGVYEELSHDLPSNPDVLIGLSRMYHKKGEVDAALRLAMEARDLDMNNPDVYRTLIALYSDKGDYPRLVKVLGEYFRKKADVSGTFDCRVCGYHADELLWRCPRCRSWQVDFKERVQ